MIAGLLSRLLTGTLSAWFLVVAVAKSVALLGPVTFLPINLYIGIAGLELVIAVGLLLEVISLVVNAPCGWLGPVAGQKGSGQNGSELAASHLLQGQSPLPVIHIPDRWSDVAYSVCCTAHRRGLRRGRRSRKCSLDLLHLLSDLRPSP